jgi:hypothetical protein
MRKPRCDSEKGAPYKFKVTPGQPFFDKQHDGEAIASPNVQVRMSMTLYNDFKKAVGDTSSSQWLRDAIAEKIRRDNEE